MAPTIAVRNTNRVTPAETWNQKGDALRSSASPQAPANTSPISPAIVIWSRLMTHHTVSLSVGPWKLTLGNLSTDSTAREIVPLPGRSAIPPTLERSQQTVFQQD